MKPPNLIYQYSVAGQSFTLQKYNHITKFNLLIFCGGSCMFKKIPQHGNVGGNTSKTHILPHINPIHRKSCLFGEVLFQVFLPIWNVS